MSAVKRSGDREARSQIRAQCSPGTRLPRCGAAGGAAGIRAHLKKGWGIQGRESSELESEIARGSGGPGTTLGDFPHGVAVRVMGPGVGARFPRKSHALEILQGEDGLQFKMVTQCSLLDAGHL